MPQIVVLCPDQPPGIPGQSPLQTDQKGDGLDLVERGKVPQQVAAHEPEPVQCAETKQLGWTGDAKQDDDQQTE